MDKKDHRQDYDVGKKSDDRRKQHSQENLEKQYKREGDCSSIGKKKDGLAWEEDGMAYMDGRIYVPNNKKLRKEILKEHHDPADIRHLKQHRMLELLKRTYWWPELKKDIKKYMQGCLKC